MWLLFNRVISLHNITLLKYACLVYKYKSSSHKVCFSLYPSFPFFTRIATFNAENVFIRVWLPTEIVTCYKSLWLLFGRVLFICNPEVSSNIYLLRKSVLSHCVPHALFKYVIISLLAWTTHGAVFSKTTSCWNYIVEKVSLVILF